MAHIPADNYRRRALRIAAALLAVLLAGWQPAAAQTTEFKAGIADPVNTVLAWWAAQAGGFYAAQGLKVDIVNMEGGSRGAAALAAGRLDVMHVGLSSVIRLNRAGSAAGGGGNLRLVGSLSNVIRFTFFSADGVKTAADLKGGTIAVSTFGSESDTTVTLALQRLGLTRGDVTLKEYGGGPRRLAALKAGEIKATTLNEPYASLAREQGVNVMVDLAAEQIPWVFSGVTVNAAAIAGRRDALKRFLRATIEGNYLALTDAKLAKDVLAKELKLTDPKIIDISYDDFKQQSPLDLAPSRPGADNILKQFPGGSSRIEDYIDTSLLDEIKAEGFITTLQQKYNKR